MTVGPPGRVTDPPSERTDEPAVPPTETPDVLVVGAGPAGSALAGLLAPRWSVVIVDRASFPRPKPCGECVNPGAVAALRRLGLLGAVLESGPARLGGWTLRTAGGRAVAGDFDIEAGPGLGIRRATLDDVLVRHAVRRGAELREGVQVTDVELDEGGRPTVTARTDGGRRRWRPEVLVGADGLRSVVARRLGMVKRRPRLRKLSVTCHVHGMGPPRDRGCLFVGDGIVVGLAPVDASGHRWNCTVVVDPARFGESVASDRAAFLRSALRRAASWTSGPRVVDGPWTSGPFDWSMTRVALGSVLLVGDAAGYYDPFTGQGIYRGLRSAELAAPPIDRRLRGGPNGASALTRYERILRRELRPGRTLQRLIEHVLSRSSSREAAGWLLSRLPGGMDALIHVTGDARPLSGLCRPSSWLQRSSGPADFSARDPLPDDSSLGVPIVRDSAGHDPVLDDSDTGGPLLDGEPARC